MSLFTFTKDRRTNPNRKVYYFWIYESPREKTRYKRGSLEAHHFLHKKSGMSVHWYKYIGRDMKINKKKNWGKILKECVESVKPQS